MARPTLQILAASFRRFNEDKCWTSAVVISYFSLLCSVPLIALFFAAAGRFLGDTEMALRSLNIFTALIQSFVFVLLSCIYIGGAIAHEEEH